MHVFSINQLLTFMEPVHFDFVFNLYLLWLLGLCDSPIFFQILATPRVCDQDTILKNLSIEMMAISCFLL